MSIAEIVGEGLTIQPDNQDQHEARVIRALQDVGLDPEADTDTPAVPGGQRQRIAIARAWFTA